MASTTITVKCKKRWFFIPALKLINPHLAFVDGQLFCPMWLVNIGIKTEIVRHG